jgi:hypothetical protein
VIAKGILYTVAALSLLAAMIHLWVVPEHFEEWSVDAMDAALASTGRGAEGGSREDGKGSYDGENPERTL